MIYNILKYKCSVIISIFFIIFFLYGFFLVYFPGTDCLLDQCTFLFHAYLQFILLYDTQIKLILIITWYLINVEQTIRNSYIIAQTWKTTLLKIWNLWPFLLFSVQTCIRKFNVCLMVFKATLNNISVILWQSVLLLEETGRLRENHRPVASHWQTLSHNVVHLALIKIQTHNSLRR